MEPIIPGMMYMVCRNGLPYDCALIVKDMLNVAMVLGSAGQPTSSFDDERNSTY
jgi:hypothetical protein